MPSCAALALLGLLTLPALSLGAQAPNVVGRDAFTEALKQRAAYRKAAGPMAGVPHWIDESPTVWFDVSSGEAHEYVLYDAVTKARTTLDKGRVAEALSKDAKPVEAGKLVLLNLRFEAKAAGFSFTTPKGRWHCKLPGYECTAPKSRHDDEDYDEDWAPHFEGNDPHKVAASPDGKWEATVENFNVFLHAKGDKAGAMALSSDGSAGDYYQFGSLAWSKDSKHLMALRVLQGMRRRVSYVESSPESQLQPLASTRFYAKPGDVLDKVQPVLFDPATRKEMVIADTLFPNAFDVSNFAWREDSSAFTFVYNQRGHQRLSLLSVDAATGQVRAVVDETSKTFVEYSEVNPEAQAAGKFYRHDLADGKEILWMSERDGWAHLYLYDGVTGRVKNQVTQGKWVVRGVDRVDEAKRQVYFEASGVDQKVDPYFVQGYRINFDGSGMTPMTSEPDANHELAYSPDGQFYVDRWSRVDLAPTMVLKTVADQKVVATLATSDTKALVAAGWRAPEVFVAKGRDGQTDIWGLIYKPAHFDAKKRYPVIENIYAGPQGSFVPKVFGTAFEPLTELGFVVAQIDGMGTNNRSKAFHDVIWKNLKDAGFEDRILWHKAVAKKYGWYDDSRVGIFGTSAGGQSAMGALLFHPEFYKAAVANSGCHDNRMDKIWWNEQWMGWPIGPEYAASSNVDNAYRLQGRLMLVMGEMDTNVDPSSTLQVTNALIKANKDYEFLDVPGGGHGAGGEYGQRRLMDFFVRSLTGASTVNWNAAVAPATPAATAGTK